MTAALNISIALALALTMYSIIMGRPLVGFFFLLTTLGLFDTALYLNPDLLRAEREGLIPGNIVPFTPEAVANEYKTGNWLHGVLSVIIWTMYVWKIQGIVKDMVSHFERRPTGPTKDLYIALDMCAWVVLYLGTVLLHEQFFPVRL